MRPVKSIDDYLPVKGPMTMIQGRVPTEIVDQIRMIMKRDNLSWSDVLTACLRRLVDERAKK